MSNYIIFDDNTFFTQHLSIVFGECNVFVAHLQQIEMSVLIANLLSDKIQKSFSIKEFKYKHKRIEWNSGVNRETFLLINTEGVYNIADRTLLKGIEFLIWLRCYYNIVNPVILYGYQSTASILNQHPEHLIIHSDGSYYIRLPFKPAQISKIKYNEIQELSSLRKFISASFDIQVYRHIFANKWGVKRLYIAHKILMDNQLVPECQQPENIEELKAQVMFIDPRLEEYNNELIELNINERLFEYRNFLKDKKILYIDDMAMHGWADALLLTLNGIKSNFRIHNFFTSDINHDVSIIRRVIDDFKPDCILLDLRLRPEDEFKSHNQPFTGAYIAEKIKSRYSSVPIIMFTASNKAENLRIAIQSGCETLWTKEGIDEYCGLDYTIQNYFKLVEIVFNACKKFDKPAAKLDYEADSLLEKLISKLESIDMKKYVSKYVNIDYFEKYDIIVFDTNQFIINNIIKLPGYVCNIYLFLYLIRNGHLKIFFHFDDEVFIELLRFCKMPISRNKEEHFRIERSRHIIGKIYQWNNSGLLRFAKPDVIGYGEKIRSKDINFYEEDFISYEQNDLNNDELKFPDEEKKHTVKYTNKKSDVHADEVLQKYIIKQIKENSKKVIYVTDDKECAFVTGNLLVGNGLSTVESNFEKIKGNSEKVQVVMKAQISNSVVYERIRSNDFHAMFDTLRQKLLE